jgi:hypothetical protein
MLARSCRRQSDAGPAEFAHAGRIRRALREDADVCRAFWIEQIGMVEKRRTAAGDVMISQVGFADQSSSCRSR